MEYRQPCCPQSWNWLIWSVRNRRVGLGYLQGESRSWDQRASLVSLWTLEGGPLLRCDLSWVVVEKAAGKCHLPVA